MRRGAQNAPAAEVADEDEQSFQDEVLFLHLDVEVEVEVEAGLDSRGLGSRTRTGR